MDLEQLLASLNACHTACKDLGAKIQVAATDEERAALRTQLKGKQAEFDSLRTQVEEAKALRTQEDTLALAKSLAAPDTTGINLNPTAPVAGAKGGRPHIEVDTDPVRKERHHRRLFLDYVQKGEAGLSGEGLAHIQAKDQRMLTVESTVTPVRLPRSMAFNVMAQTPYGGKVLVDPYGDRVCIERNEQYGGKVILSTDATGGSTDSGAANLLAPDFRPQLLTMPVAAPSIYDQCRFIPAVNGLATWPKLDQDQGNYGGVAFTWKATEGADKGDTEPVFTDFSITTNELSGWTEMSLTAIRRSALDLEAILTMLYRDAARYEFSRCVLRGSGPGGNQPQGIVGTSGVNLINRVAANKVDWEDLTELEYALRQGWRAQGRYACNDDVEKYLKQQVDTQKRPLYTADFASQIRNLLAGYQYNAHEYGPALGTKGDIVFGNFQQYGWAMEEDIAIARSEHAEFKKGRIVFRMICFVGGKTIYPKAFSVLDVPAT